METRILDEGDAGDLADFLTPRIETSLFLRNNSLHSGLVDRGGPFHGTYAGAFEAGALVGVAAHYWNGMILLQAPGCARALARFALDASSYPLAGVIGPLRQTIEALSALEIERSSLRRDSPERLFSLALAELIRPEARDGQYLEGRPAQKADISQLMEWRLAYDHELMNTPPTPEHRERVIDGVERQIAAQAIYVLSDHDTLVSMTAFNAEIPDIVQIGGVWTPPHLRGRGYARGAVARHLATARERGIEKAILFTGYENIAAQRAYIALGFEQIGDYGMMILGD